VIHRKRAFPLGKVYTLLEPGPVLLVSTLPKRKARDPLAGRPNVMPLSWHLMMDFEPPVIGFVLSNRNFSYAALKSTRECVVNIPTAELAEKVVACGNCSGVDTDKFAEFGLTASPSKMVAAPQIAECYASLECRVMDTRLTGDYCLFILVVLAAKVDTAVKAPKTLHHRGYGKFMVAGREVKLPSLKA